MNANEGTERTIKMGVKVAVGGMGGEGRRVVQTRDTTMGTEGIGGNGGNAGTGGTGGKGGRGGAEGSRDLREMCGEMSGEMSNGASGGTSGEVSEGVNEGAIRKRAGRVERDREVSGRATAGVLVLTGVLVISTDCWEGWVAPSKIAPKTTCAAGATRITAAERHAPVVALTAAAGARGAAAAAGTLWRTQMGMTCTQVRSCAYSLARRWDAATGTRAGFPTV